MKSRSKRQNQFERLYQPSGGNVICRQVSPAQHDARPVDGGLKRKIGLAEAWPARGVYAPRPGGLQPSVPVRRNGVEAHGVIVEQYLVTQIIRAAQRACALEQARAA